MSGLTAASLFAGVGGIDLALERAGFAVTTAVEIDTAASGVLADHFKATTLRPDVTKVTGDDLRADGLVPERGLLAAGWPCQGNSVAGRRGGMADPRSGLWSHVVRLLAETRPTWFLGENVPGLLSVNDGRDFAVVVRDLADLGYGFCWRVLDAQHFGVPQRRRRVVIVGCLGDDRRPVEVLLEPEGGGGHPATRHTSRPGVAATLTAGAHRPGVSSPGRRAEDDANLVAFEGNGGHGAVAPTLTAPATGGRRDKVPMVMNALTTRSGDSLDDQQTTQLVVAALTSAGVGTCGPDDNQAQAGHLLPYQRVVRPGARDADGNLPPDAWAQRGGDATLSPFDLGSDSRAVELVVHPLAVRGREGGAQLEVGPAGGPFNALRAGDGGSSRTPLVSITGPRTHPLTSEGHDASEDGTGRGTPLVAFHLTQDPISGARVPALGRKSGGQGVATEATVRRLTPRECERLQGFPDDWTATSNGRPQADSPRYQQMGNAVAVPVFEWVARRIVASKPRPHPSHGATHCADLATAAGIDVRRYTEEETCPDLS